MAIVTGDRYLESLVKFVDNQAEKLIEGTLVLKLNPVGLRYVQSRLEALGELESLLTGAPVDYLRAYVSDLGDHRALEQLRRILRLLPSLKVVSVLPPLRRDPTPLYLLPFGRLKVLELRGCDLSTSAAKGLLELRFTLEKLICHNSTLLPMVETLDLSRNKFAKVDNLKKCTKLKHVDFGFNSLRSMASFSEVHCQIVQLVLRNNALTSLHGIENLKSLEGLDLSYNIISNFSEIEILAGFPSLQNLWLEGNPLCCARWFRAKVFSLFSHPDLLNLDEKKISACEFWKRQIIISGRKKQPASFGFYSPIQDDADVEGSVNTKRKRASRLVSIRIDERSTDQDSVSCDNEIESKDGTANTDEEAEIEDLIKRIEDLKKDNSVQWLQEFKEWMDHTSENVVDGNKFRSSILHKTEEMHLKSETRDEDHAEPSIYVSDSFQLSGDESSTIILGSETSFADTSTVFSAQQYFTRIGEVASRLFMGNAVGDRSVFKNFNESREVVGLVNNEGSISADTGDSQVNSLEVPRGDNLSADIITVPSTAINDVGSHSPSACPGSPPYYQEDILHRRQNLEEEFLHISAESFSVESSDSNTSCSEEEDYVQFGPSVSHIDHPIFGNSSERSHDSFGNISSSKQNGVHTSIPFAEGNSVTNGRECEFSLAASGSLSDAVDDEISGFVKEKTDILEKNTRRRKPRRKMISLLEEDEPGDTDSSMKSGDYVET
ncbi:hypothetical protein ACS0TY_030484 [Phlomoides rotata]